MSPGVPSIPNPAQALRAAFDQKAHLVIERGKNKGKRIPLKFNPTEFVLAKQNTFSEVPIPGLTAPPIQYVRGTSEKLTFDAIVDTSDSLEDVRKQYVDAIRGLLNVDATLHAPPIVRFVWHESEFVGVLESLNVTYTLFTPEGRPIRAKLQLGLKEFTTVEEQARKYPKESPDVEKDVEVKRGDSLSALAEQAYGTGREWRRIARANAIFDPRSLEPGMRLTIPRGRR